ncbi:uncharacterized protein LOC144358454 [Saccoglossus kowalevskii]
MDISSYHGGHIHVPSSTLVILGESLLQVVDRVTVCLIETLGSVAIEFIQKLQYVALELIHKTYALGKVIVESITNVLIQLITSLQQMCRDPNICTLITTSLSALQALGLFSTSAIAAATV